MATATVTLDDLRKGNGVKLLALTDEFGFAALGAAWVYDRDAERWWYLLVSPMIDSKGPAWVYERLVALFRKLHLPEGISPLDIRIASPKETTFHQLAKQMTVADRPVSFSHARIGGLEITAMHVYRMLTDDGRSGERARNFDARYQELMAA